MTRRQTLFDGALTGEEPVHRFVAFVLVSVGNAQIKGEGSARPPAAGGQLGLGGKHPGGNEAQDNIGLPGTAAPKKLPKVQTLHRQQDSLGVAARKGFGNLEGRFRIDQAFFLEGAANHGDDLRRQVRNIPHGLVLDLPSFPIAAPQQVRLIDFPAVGATSCGDMNRA